MATWVRLEKCLLPPPETVHWNQGNLIIKECATTEKVTHYVTNFVAFAGLVLVSPLTLAYDWLTQKEVTPMSCALEPQSRVPAWPPAQRGFATSLFQTSGLGTKWSASPKFPGKCDWDKWMDNPAHVKSPNYFGFNNDDFFTDILSDPSTYIEMLKAHHVTAHRFSLEWSIIEPQPGELDMNAVHLYRNFIQKLIDAGITPSITLNHFVVLAWFYEHGNFQKIENVEAYVSFALKVMELFPDVQDWWSFNELGIKAFQQTREMFPTDLPEGSSLPERVHAAGVSTRNMLIAHCKLHCQVTRLYPNKKLGVTHQWLKFDMASGNFFEKLFKYYFEKFGFQPVYGFFKDGHYTFEFPFMANIHFEIPQEVFDANEHFLMRLGVQAYPKAMVKMGLNEEQKPPC